MMQINRASAVFCSEHNESDKRIKVEPQTRPCQNCHQELTTNYKDFALCPNCSGTIHKCMICGKPAVGSSAGGGAGPGASPGMQNGFGAPPPPPVSQGQTPSRSGAPARHVGTTCDSCGERDFQ